MAGKHAKKQMPLLYPIYPIKVLHAPRHFDRSLCKTSLQEFDCKRTCLSQVGEQADEDTYMTWRTRI